MTTISPGRIASSVRFAAEPKALIQQFTKKSKDRHDELSRHAKSETLEPKSVGQKLRNIGGYLLMSLASLGALGGSYKTHQEYQSQVLTSEQVAQEKAILQNKETLSTASSGIIHWISGENNKPETKLMPVEKLNALENALDNFFTAFRDMLLRSPNAADKALGQNLLTILENKKSEQMTTDLLTYLKEQDTKGEGLQVEAFLAKQPELSALSAREREYVSSHIARLYNESAKPASQIQNLLQVQMLSKMAGIGVSDLQSIKSQADLATLFENGVRNPAVYPQLSAADRELLIPRGKEFIASLTYKAHEPPSQNLKGLEALLMAVGVLGTGFSTIVGFSSVKEKMKARKKRMEMLATQKPIIVLQKSPVPSDKIQELGRELGDCAKSLVELRKVAFMHDSEVRRFFVNLNNGYHLSETDLPDKSTLTDYYKNKAQEYFLTDPKQQEVPFELFLQKALELIQADLENQEYVPELMFDNTAEIPRLTDADVINNFTQEQLNQVMDRLDADVMENIKLEMNQRIMMASTRRKLADLEEQAAQAGHGASASEGPPGSNLKDLKPQVLEKMQQTLDHILSNRITLEENRVNWQLMWLKHNENEEYQKILGSLTHARNKAEVEQDGEGLKSLQANVNLAGRVVATRIKQLSEQQSEVASAMEKARAQQKKDGSQ